ncbi:MAG: alkaline phosphatase family protein, partial [Desulfamplus sp.]|nr:alkaline phosphatase family protein [Desulfamplus sp.]
TEKYAHVTYFFNGGDEKVFPLEERILIPSPRDVKTYDQKPEMSAHAVAKAACKRIEEGDLRLMVLNFANMDMVGHTGNLDAAIKACSTVDECVKQVVEAVFKTGGTVMVTADHGNAEEMRDKDGNPHTAHTLNPVKFIVAGDKYRNIILKDGVLGDIAPTILKIMGIDQPKEMTGKPLF